MKYFLYICKLRAVLERNAVVRIFSDTRVWSILCCLDHNARIILSYRFVHLYLLKLLYTQTLVCKLNHWCIFGVIEHCRDSEYRYTYIYTFESCCKPHCTVYWELLGSLCNVYQSYGYACINSTLTWSYFWFLNGVLNIHVCITGNSQLLYIVHYYPYTIICPPNSDLSVKDIMKHFELLCGDAIWHPTVREASQFYYENYLCKKK